MHNFLIFEEAQMDFTDGRAEALGHMGIIAGTLQDTGIMEKIDSQLGRVEGGVRYGQRVGAMILNGLGFMNTALYMTPRFFHDKPLDLLLGEGVSAEQLNDDCLGRCLDKIAAYGTTRWYSEIALSVVRTAGLLSRSVHIDSTTLTLYGEYEMEAGPSGPQPLLGYSKDHRPDLKQVTLQCVSLGKSALPIWMEALDGNSSDKKSFPDTVRRVDSFYKAIQEAPPMCFIGDSALYGKELRHLPVDWLTRVPESYSECKSLCQLRDVAWQETQDSRYQMFPYSPKEGNERWLLVRSEPAFQRECETFYRKQRRIFEELHSALWHGSCQTFRCEQDARQAVEKIIRSKKHDFLVDYVIKPKLHFKGKGRPKANAIPDKILYQFVILGIASDYKKVVEKRNILGRFVLATNVVEEGSLSHESMLFDYKEQGEIERGFRFIKNDTFGLDEIYLKKPERIGALMAIMTLCLLVYGLTQYRLRNALAEKNEFLPNQKGKATQRPTLLWIMTLFSSITVVNVRDRTNNFFRLMMNLQPLHVKVILLLGGTARKIYGLSDHLTLNRVELNQKTWLKWCGI